MLQDFYRDPTVADNNFRNMKVPLSLNCTGHEAFDRSLFAASSRRDVYLFYLSEGEIAVNKPVEVHLRAGDLILFAPDIPYVYHSVTPRSSHYFAHFTGYAAEDLVAMCGLRFATRYTVDRPEPIEARFEALFRTFLTRDALFDAASASKLLALLVTASRHVRAAGEAVDSARLVTSLAYLHASYAEPVTVRELARMEFMSESRYRTLFRAATGRSPTEYLATLRLRAACELLELTDMPVGEVSAAVGYADARYFSRLFRRAHGMPPGDYRRACAERSDS